ncbi:hypothetical protein CF68_33120 [Cupriavidus sp. SK-4]|uniref:hypothetical protein n=1 Tax=Cupriavidus sp. SK-4 TaxID=574750 RepID=UPI00044D0E62|nr:hypothetical protein [Cupriavidus sp. SK-4]EYS89531.1 hypothetical protein CF68_33120 [Cupriavidus sp. SK-4]
MIGKSILAAVAAMLAPMDAARQPQPLTRKPGRLTQADHARIAAAEAKRERKAKKLRRAA